MCRLLNQNFFASQSLDNFYLVLILKNFSKYFVYSKDKRTEFLCSYFVQMHLERQNAKVAAAYKF